MAVAVSAGAVLLLVVGAVLLVRLVPHPEDDAGRDDAAIGPSTSDRRDGDAGRG